MNLFTGLFRSRDKPQNSTAGSSYSFFMGGSTAGKSVTERSAMQMTAVYSCVRILAEAVAGLPLHLYRYTEEGGKEKATDHPLYLLLHDEPNPEMSSFWSLLLPIGLSAAWSRGFNFTFCHYLLLLATKLCFPLPHRYFYRHLLMASQIQES